MVICCFSALHFSFCWDRNYKNSSSWSRLDVRLSRIFRLWLLVLHRQPCESLFLNFHYIAIIIQAFFLVPHQLRFWLNMYWNPIKTQIFWCSRWYFLWACSGFTSWFLPLDAGISVYDHIFVFFRLPGSFWKKSTSGPVSTAFHHCPGSWPSSFWWHASLTSSEPSSSSTATG